MKVIVLFLISSLYALPSANLSEEQWDNKGTSLFIHKFEDLSEVKSNDVILFIQGRNESVDSYDNFAFSYMERYAIDVVLYDARGQGRSSGKRCHLDSIDEHISDLKFIVERLREEYENVHVTTHSTGGLVASLTLAKYPDLLGPKGTLSMGSPLIEMNNSPMFNMTVAALAKFMSFTPFSSNIARNSCESVYEGNDLTSVKELYEKIVKSPYLCGEPTWGWLNAVFDGMKELENIKQNIKVPVLVMGAGEDKVVSTKAAKRFCDSLPKNCEFKVYEGMEHVLFQEKVREDVFDKIWKFREKSSGLKIPYDSI